MQFVHQIGAAGHAVGGELSWEAVSSRELAEAKSAPKRIGARVQKFEFVSMNYRLTYVSGFAASQLLLVMLRNQLFDAGYGSLRACPQSPH